MSKKFNNTTELVEHLIVLQLNGDLNINYDEYHDKYEKTDPYYHRSTQNLHENFQQQYEKYNAHVDDIDSKEDNPVLSLSEIIKRTVDAIDNKENRDTLMSRADEYSKISEEYNQFIIDGEKRMAQHLVFQLPEFKQLDKQYWDLNNHQLPIIKNIFRYFLVAYDDIHSWGWGCYDLYEHLIEYYKSQTL